MLLSPRSFRRKVNGSFDPPSSSGVGTLPTGPDKPWPRRTLRSAIHEEASVKTRARRSRDFPDIHSASSAVAERHETLCGCSHSHQRRRSAPCRTPGCNLSPALDLDRAPPEPGPRHFSTIAPPLGLVLRQAIMTSAWRSGVRLCRRATGQGISRPTVCQGRIRPLHGDVLRGHFSAIGHRSHASQNAP